MIRYRLINCDFLVSNPFTKNLSNKAKLLYYSFITNADDLGFVGNSKSIVESLTACDDELHQVSLELLKNDYVSALVELINKNYIYQFYDKLGNDIYLIKHWFYHNRWIKGLRTNYYGLYRQVVLVDNQYYLKENIEEVKEKETKKENKEKEIKSKEIKVNTKDNCSQEEWNDLMAQLEEQKKEREEDE